MFWGQRGVWAQVLGLHKVGQKEAESSREEQNQRVAVFWGIRRHLGTAEHRTLEKEQLMMSVHRQAGLAGERPGRAEALELGSLSGAGERASRDSDKPFTASTWFTATGLENQEKQVGGEIIVSQRESVPAS